MLTPSPDLRGLRVDALDLEARYNDVRRLICSHSAFRAAVASGKVNADDLRQDVLLAIMERQRTASAWDPRRSSLAKYVWIVTWCVTSNILRKNSGLGRGYYASDRGGDRITFTGSAPALDRVGEAEIVADGSAGSPVNHSNILADGVSHPGEQLDLEEQLVAAAKDLGLSAYQRKVLLAAAAGDLRIDDARVVALGQIVRARMAE